MLKKRIISIFLSSMLIASTLFVHPVFAEPEFKHEQAFWNKNANVPIFVKEKLAKKHGSSNPANALNYLDETDVGIESPEENLKIKSAETDELGMTHIRFQQVKDDVPVDGNEIIVHFNQNNEVVTVNGHYNKNVEEQSINTEAAIKENAALDIAKASVQAPSELSFEPTVELVVYPFEGENYLTYKVNLSFLGDNPGNWFVYVDAHSGKVIDKVNALLHADIIKKQHHKGVGNGVHGDLRHLHTTKEIMKGQGAIFKLYDESHDGLEGIYTYDYNTLEVFENNSASWKDEYQSPAVDAHYNSEKVYEYYLEEHGRNSLDDNGMAIISYVHYGTNYNNAFWNGRFMAYGDGDGEFMVPLSAGLDVAAHEMTHGVITHTANLQYRFQPGALNESFADVFGALVDEDDWEIGEDIMAPAAKAEGRTALRSLSKPSKFPVSEERAPYGSGYYPEHMDEYYDMPLNVDNGGVHVNSSIPNHAAYLIGEQIGKQKLGQIYYRALTVYLTPTSNFSDARNAIVQSAIDLYGEGSAEVQAVESGFDQVGIY